MLRKLSLFYAAAHEEDTKKLARRKSRLSSVEDDRKESVDEAESNNVEKQDENYETDMEENEADLIEDHQKWDPQSVAVLYMIGYIVGMSNCWHFPYLCRNYGGIAFLIPYFVFLIFIAYPFAYLELLVGQIAQVGHMSCWKLVPLFKGIGYCTTILAYMLCFHIQSTMAWAFFYLFQSTFFHPLPWVSCDNGFGKERNGQKQSLGIEVETDENRNWHTANCIEYFESESSDEDTITRLPGAEYFRGRVQRFWKSGFADRTDGYVDDNGIEMFGIDEDTEAFGVLAFNVDTIICLLFCFLVLMTCLIKGIKIYTRLMFIAVILPFIIMVLLLFRCSGLNGADHGLAEGFSANFSKLMESNTWWKAAEQVLGSTGCGYGIILSFGSHYQFDHDIFMEITGCCILNTLTSLILSAIVFMLAGHAAVSVNGEIEHFIFYGPQLAFEGEADALGILPKSNFYAFCFYLMLFVLGLTTCVPLLVVAKASMVEALPVSIKFRAFARTMLFGLLMVMGFVIAMLNLSRGGLQIYNFMAVYMGSFSIHACNWMFFVGIAWIWGTRDIVEATKLMGVRQPGIFFQFCWRYVAVIIFVVLIVGRALDTSTYHVILDNKVIKLSDEMQIFGHVISVAPFGAVIITAIYEFCKAKGKNCKEKFLVCISPTREHAGILETGTGKRANLSHYFYFYAPTDGSNIFNCCQFYWPSKVKPADSRNSTVGGETDVTEELSVVDSEKGATQEKAG